MTVTGSGSSNTSISLSNGYHTLGAMTVTSSDKANYKLVMAYSDPDGSGSTITGGTFTSSM